MTTRILAVALILALAPACADDDRNRPARNTADINPGLGVFIYQDNGDNADRPVRVWYYLPDVISKIVFVMHGGDRDAEDTLRQFLPYADRYGAMLVAPEFRWKHYPDADDYARGFVKDGGGTGSFRARKDWTFLTIEEIFDFIRSEVPGAPATYSIGGNSAGGQFISRLAWLVPEARYDTAAGSNAGWYTLPIPGEVYPNGIADFPITDGEIVNAFARPFLLLIGELDTDPDSYDLEHNPFTDGQGMNRYDRAHFYHTYMSANALARGAPFQWDILDVAETGHPARKMAHATAMALFEGVRTQPHTSLLPVADTYAAEGSPTRNYGRDIDVRMDGGSTPKTAYLKFDLSGIAPGDFDVAALKIWITDESDDTYSVRAVPDTGWGETFLTWNNAPPSLQEIGSTKGAYEDGYLYIVITDYVKTHAGNPISFTIESTDLLNKINRMAFYSKEAPDRHPVLDLFSN